MSHPSIEVFLCFLFIVILVIHIYHFAKINLLKHFAGNLEMMFTKCKYHLCSFIANLIVLLICYNEIHGYNE